MVIPKVAVTAVKITVSFLWLYACLAVIAPKILLEAYKIRLLSINEYGKVSKDVFT